MFPMVILITVIIVVTLIGEGVVNENYWLIMGQKARGKHIAPWGSQRSTVVLGLGRTSNQIKSSQRFAPRR